ncbi:hypothetical protein BOX15_Mlig023635g1 [Macrostomum lignano]|uniref:RNA-dependent RNA polymerase n=1 Tax=Macrostomum lignano TaxID=282301 RepID=A0A267FD57_9PLAT|nr:hypothetical protein BOX15_Mlig023635g1 [Macrostomum lignano]
MVDWSKELIALPLAVAPTILKTVEQEDQQNDWDFNPISSESFCNTEDLSGKIRQKFETNSVLILHLPRAPRSAEPLDWMRLRATFPLPLLDTRLESEEYASPGESETLFEYCHRVKPFQELSVRDKAEFQCRWQMQALIDSRRFLITQESAAGIENRIAAAAQADSELDNDCPTNLIKLANALLTLSATGDGDAFFEDVLGDRLNSALSVLEVTDEDAEDAAVGPPVACGSLLVKRVAVTPTRVVLFPATPVASSRLLRRIPPERLVMVAFTDESCGVVRGGGVNVASAASVGARFTKVLRDGLTLAGRMYRFFSASSGQLRTSRCFFVAAESVEEVQRLRDQLVENPTEFRSVSKYLSRLGLFHTADTWVAKLETNQVSKCIDHRALNDDLLTDGSGKISSELAMSIKSKLDLPELPFAFQFRFGGAKGVLTTVSDTDPKLELQQGISLRPSTVKFKSSDTNLCIVGTSQCGRLCLNREIITLLEALASKCDSWNPSQRLRNILDAELRKIAESLATPSAATAALREFIDKPSLATASVVEAARHFNFLTDPHWLGLLRCVFRFRLSDLQKRAALPVGDLGCRVMGAPDPLEVLAEGQVFLRIKRKPSDQAKQIEGPVLIYRNPCLHPGDVRVVQAVAKPQLCGWLNLLLLPSRTDCRRSLAADCSGGDLDGDQFGVVWDPELVPPLEAVHEPLDYAKLASNEPQLPEGADVTNPVLLANFCAQNFANSFLGRVANLHLAICDQLPGGALNQLAIEVAKAQSVAVDFPKTGIVPEVPEAAVKFVKEKGYPDFMERSDSYPSDKLLGQLYRRCRSCDLDWDLLDSIDQENQQYEYDVTWAGQEKFLKSASRLFELYRSDLRALMSQWGARSDRELQLGRCFQWHPLLRTDRGRAHIAMRQGFDALGNKYRRIFDQLAGDDQNKRRAQAAAWFAVAYKSVGTSKAKKPRGLSFPWVVTDVLCEIRSHGMSTSVLQTGSASLQSIDEGLEVSIGRSVFAFFRKSLPGLRDAVGRADAAAALVSGRLSQQCAGVLSCKVYGSASILVCDEASSDIDLCVLPLDKAYSEPWLPAEVSVLGECARHRHWLETLVWPSLDAAVLEKTRYLDRQVPLIRCRLGLDGGEDVDDGQECDISMNSVGLGKTRYLLSLYSRCPWRLPLLWLLVQWARAAGIVRSSSESQGLMPTAEFYALVLHCFSEFDEVASNFEESNKCLLDLSLSERLAFLMDRLTDKASDANFAFLGSCILRFVRFCSELSGAVTYKWQRVESASSVQISAEVVRGVAELADVASRVLVYTHSAASIVSSAAIISSLSGKAIRLTQRLPGILSTEMLRSLRFHETRLRLTTGCDSVQLEETTGSRRLLIRAIGAPSAIDRLRHELRELSARFGLSGSWTRKYNNGLRYFLEGGGTVMATRCLSNSCRIELIDHLGSVNVEHQMHDVCVPLCLGTDGIDFTSWTDEAARRLFALMCRQFSRLRSSGLNAKFLQC